VKIVVTNIQGDDETAWDEFVANQRYSSVYHLSKWENLIRESYNHSSYYLAAMREIPDDIDTLTDRKNESNRYDIDRSKNSNGIIGVLPLIQMKHWLFGNSLVSMPFFDSGGILSNDSSVEKAILDRILVLAENLKVNSIELRHMRPLVSLTGENLSNSKMVKHQVKYQPAGEWICSLSTQKSRMVLELPDSADLLMKSFKSKLRSQIRKPMKEGLNVKIGGNELFADFYNVFAENMRDLGSPVHSRKFIRQVLTRFKDTSKIFIVYKNKEATACSLVIGHKNTLANPWASSLRKYSRLSPNMLLYWSMLEYACDRGFNFFDFGRSTPDEGTYKFKEQWGAKPEPLYWYKFTRKNDKSIAVQPEKDNMGKAIEYWKKLPVPVTKILGPRIRKYIAL